MFRRIPRVRLPGIAVRFSSPFLTFAYLKGARPLIIFRWTLISPPFSNFRCYPVLKTVIFQHLTMHSRFPLQQPPNCPVCGSAATRQITQSQESGNFLRPYYNCRSGHGSKFITWDDDRDVHSDNPPCSCGHPSRLHQGNGPNAGSWLACSAKQCTFKREMRITEHVVELDSTPQNPGILQQDHTVYSLRRSEEPVPYVFPARVLVITL